MVTAFGGRRVMDSEARYRMPAELWRRAMDVFFPSSAWLRLSRDVFDRLWAFRSEQTLRP